MGPTVKAYWILFMGITKSRGLYGYLRTTNFDSRPSFKMLPWWAIPAVKEKSYWSSSVYRRFNQKLANGYSNGSSHTVLVLKVQKPVEVLIYFRPKYIHFRQNISILSRDPIPLSCPEPACNRPGLQVCDRGNSGRAGAGWARPGCTRGGRHQSGLCNTRGSLQPQVPVLPAYIKTVIGCLQRRFTDS
jgi:hypothetical protein